MALRISVAAIAFTGLLLLGGCDFLTSPETRLARAQQYVDERDYGRAAIELKNVVQKQPENALARLLLAEVSLQMGDPQSADIELKKALANGANATAAADITARIGLATGRFRALADAIQKQQLPVAEPQRSLYLGQALNGAREYARSADVFRTLIGNESSAVAVNARIGLAESLAARGDEDHAMQELGAALARQPDSALALLVRAQILARHGQLAEAQESLETARKTADKQLPLQQRSSLLALLTEIALSRGELDVARDSQRELAGIAASHPITRLLGARLSLAGQDFNAATSALQRLSADFPNFVAARVLLGAALLDQGNLEQAESQLGQVLQSAPTSVEARKLLAQVRLRLQRPDAAIQVLMPVLQDDRADPQIGALFEAAQLQRGDDPSAIAFLERSAAENPGNNELRLHLATAYLRSGRQQSAIDLLKSMSGETADSRRDALLVAALASAKGINAATTEIDGMIAAKPDDPAVLNLAGAYYASQGRYDRSLSLLAKAAKVKPGDVNTLLSLARVNVAAGNPGDAVSALEQVLKIDNKNTLARLGMAEIAARRGDIATATRWLEEVRAQDPKASEPRLALARLYLLGGKQKEAEAVVAEAVDANSTRGDVYNAAGLMYLGSGQPALAFEKFQDATRIDASNAMFWVNQARTALVLKRASDAGDAVKKALALQPDSVQVVGIAALTDLQTGKPEAALKRIERLERSRPDDAAVLVLKGDLLSAMERYGDAAAAFGTAAKLRPESAVALKAFRARQQGRLEHPTEPLQRWLEQRPDDYVVRSVLAEAYQVAGDQPQAIKEYESVIATNPRTPAALNNLAWLYDLTGDSRAVEVARRAYDLAPNNPSILDTYGWILMRQGKIEDGIKYLTLAAKALPESPDIQYHYGAALARSGDRANALRTLKAINTRNAGFADRGAVEKLIAELSSH